MHSMWPGRRRPLNWRLELVPGVAHDFRAMGRAAARLLYGEAA